MSDFDLGNGNGLMPGNPTNLVNKQPASAQEECSSKSGGVSSSASSSDKKPRSKSCSSSRISEFAFLFPASIRGKKSQSPRNAPQNASPNSPPHHEKNRREDQTIQKKALSKRPQNSNARISSKCAANKNFLASDECLLLKLDFMENQLDIYSRALQSKVDAIKILFCQNRDIYRENQRLHRQLAELRGETPTSPSLPTFCFPPISSSHSTTTTKATGRSHEDVFELFEQLDLAGQQREDGGYDKEEEVDLPALLVPPQSPPLPTPPSPSSSHSLVFGECDDQLELANRLFSSSKSLGTDDVFFQFLISIISNNKRAPELLETNNKQRQKARDGNSKRAGGGGSSRSASILYEKIHWLKKEIKNLNSLFVQVCLSTNLYYSVFVQQLKINRTLLQTLISRGYFKSPANAASTKKMEKNWIMTKKSSFSFSSAMMNGMPSKECDSLITSLVTTGVPRHLAALID